MHARRNRLMSGSALCLMLGSVVVYGGTGEPSTTDVSFVATRQTADGAHYSLRDYPAEQLEKMSQMAILLIGQPGHARGRLHHQLRYALSSDNRSRAASPNSGLSSISPCTSSECGAALFVAGAITRGYSIDDSGRALRLWAGDDIPEETTTSALPGVSARNSMVIVTSVREDAQGQKVKKRPKRRAATKTVKQSHVASVQKKSIIKRSTTNSTERRVQPRRVRTPAVTFTDPVSVAVGYGAQASESRETTPVPEDWVTQAEENQEAQTEEGSGDQVFTASRVAINFEDGSKGWKLTVPTSDTTREWKSSGFLNRTSDAEDHDSVSFEYHLSDREISSYSEFISVWLAASAKDRKSSAKLRRKANKGNKEEDTTARSQLLWGTSEKDVDKNDPRRGFLAIGLDETPRQRELLLELLIAGDGGLLYDVGGQLRFYHYDDVNQSGSSWNTGVIPEITFTIPWSDDASDAGNEEIRLTLSAEDLNLVPYYTEHRMP